MCIVDIPPGLNNVMLVKLIYFNINKLSINDIPVSDAPTINIRVLLLTFNVLRSFLVIMDNENGASSWSNAFL
jgi:hypothetical protein